MEADLVKGPFSQEEVAKGIEVIVELCQGVSDGRGMSDEWALSVVVPICKGKGDAMSCGVYRGARACNEDCRKGAGEEIVVYGESG